MRPAIPTPRAADAGWFLRELTDSRLVDPAELTPLVDRFRTEVGGDDAEKLADFLVRAGLLNRFQADRALAGDANTLVLGPYRVVAPLGAGGMGAVFRAVGRADGKAYAVKVLPLRSMWNVHVAKRQLAAFAALPPNPAVIPLVAIDTAGGSHYLVWPFADGVSLDRLAERLAPFPPADAARMTADAADGLAVCHRHGIVHGLLKPSNLLFDPDGRVRLLDLGVGAILCENLSDDETMFDTISTANAAGGMMDCSAPETLADPTNRTPAGDAYSLGCVLYFLLTGQYPFPDGNTVDKILAHQTREPAPVKERNPASPPALADIISRLMRKSPAARPPDLAAVAAALRGLASPAVVSPIAAQQNGSLPKPPPPVPPSPPPATAAPIPPPYRPRRPPVFGPTARPEEVIDFNLPTEVGDLSAPGTTVTPKQPVRLRVTTPPFPVPGIVVTPPPPAVRVPRPRIPGAKVALPPEPRFPFARMWWAVVRTLLPWLAARDVVQISLFGPADVAPGEPRTFQLYAHPPAEFAATRALARSGGGPAELLATGFAAALVRRGRPVALGLAIPTAGIPPTAAVIVWDGAVRAAAVEVRFPKRANTGQHPGELAVRVGGKSLVTLSFQIGVRVGRA
ncbi:MAG: serine/threonine-protein kinase [Fimbriiglobus sp.]